MNDSSIIPPGSSVRQRDPRDRYSAIPQELRALRAFLLWKKRPRNDGSGRFDKIPYYAADGTIRHGEQGSPEDRAKLATFEDALAALSAAPEQYAGLGIAMLPDFGLVGLDFDGCVDERGAVADWVLDLVAGTYAEKSPSGRGVRAFFRGEMLDFKNHSERVEVFHSQGFLTLTGDREDLGYYDVIRAP